MRLARNGGEPAAPSAVVLDGADHVCAEVFQALNDVGFTIAAAGGTCWVGEAMRTTDYVDAGPKPDTTGAATTTPAANTAHLARLLAADRYPPAGWKGRAP